MDYDTALTITTELIAMEIVNRVFVTLFEVTHPLIIKAIVFAC